MLDTHEVHELDTHMVQMLDTHEVHELDTHAVQMLDTHEVHLQLKTFKQALLLIIMSDTQSGAFIEEGLQVSSSVYYHVRHPSGAFIEEDLQASSSTYYHVRHPKRCINRRRPSSKFFCLLSC